MELHMAEEQSYRIDRIVAENLKRIVKADARMTGYVAEVIGRNAQGKSSFIDAVMFALAGADSLPPEPIRTGQDAGLAGVDLVSGSGETLHVRRVLNRGARPTLSLT